MPPKERLGHRCGRSGECDWRGGSSARGQAGDEAQVTFIHGALSNGTWHSEHRFLCSPRCQD